VEVTEAHVARIPAGNLRVSRAEFAAVWRAAERQSREQGDLGVTDWYSAGVALTCRWLAGAVTTTQTGRQMPAFAPVSSRSARAYEELIETEYLAAEQLDMLRPDLVAARRGWCEAVRATLRWAWRHEGPPPLPLPDIRAAG
jgi:hypothetical protein